MRYFLLLFVTLIILQSCERPEKAIKPYPRGGNKIGEISMGVNYDYQVYYNLNLNKIEAKINKMDWDLAFHDQAQSHIITLNMARNMKVCNTHKSSLDMVNDTVSYKFDFDKVSQHQDSTAFGKYWEKDEVYIINMGNDNAGLPLGFIKCIPKLISNQKLQITYSALNNNENKILIINASQAKFRTQISFLNHQVQELEPDKSNFDIIFTQYQKWVTDFGKTQLYIVNGVLTESHLTQVKRIIKHYDSISISDFDTPFSIYRDEIGYNWKSFNMGTNSYEVNSNWVYLIKSKEGFRYKLRFIDFYNNLGEKGCPKFEFQKL